MINKLKKHFSLFFTPRKIDFEQEKKDFLNRKQEERNKEWKSFIDSLNAEQKRYRDLGLKEGIFKTEAEAHKTFNNYEY